MSRASTCSGYEICRRKRRGRWFVLVVDHHQGDPCDRCCFQGQCDGEKGSVDSYIPAPLCQYEAHWEPAPEEGD